MDNVDTAIHHDRATILIVEDHEALRTLLRTWVGEAFPEDLVLDAPSGEEAVALATAQPPDLVLMDVQLPEMNGIEAARQIKAIAPPARVVMLTFLDDAALRLVASEVGASAYVSKHRMHSELIPVIKALRTRRDGGSHPASEAGPAVGAGPKACPGGVEE